MTLQELEIIIKNKKLPKDELNNFWNNIGGVFLYLPFVLSVSLQSPWELITISALLAVYTTYLYKNERNLITISTNKAVDINNQVVKTLIKKLNLTVIKHSNNYFEVYAPATFLGLSEDRYKVTLITIDNKILFNLRNIGSWDGRIPFSFGFTNKKTKNIIQEIKLLTTFRTQNPVGARRSH